MDDRDRLLHRALDGEVTPDERTGLDAWLARDADARRRLDELEATTRLLAAVPTAEPPAGLAARVLEALPERHPVQRTRQPFAPVKHVFAHLVEEMRSALRAQPALAYAFTLVLGVALGVAAYGALADGLVADNPAGPDAADVVGTIGASGTATRQAALSLPGLEGTVRVTRSDGGIVAELEMDAAAEAEVLVTYPSAAVRWRTLARSAPGTDGRVRIEEGGVRIGASGPTHYAITFEALSAGTSAGASEGMTRAPLTFTVSRAGRVLFQETF